MPSVKGQQEWKELLCMQQSRRVGAKHLGRGKCKTCRNLVISSCQQPQVLLSVALLAYLLLVLVALVRPALSLRVSCCSMMLVCAISAQWMLLYAAAPAPAAFLLLLLPTVGPAAVCAPCRFCRCILFLLLLLHVAAPAASKCSCCHLAKYELGTSCPGQSDVNVYTACGSIHTPPSLSALHCAVLLLLLL